MGHYENGGSNVIGVATTSSWAAVWTVDTPYIDVLTREFFDAHEAEIRETASRGEVFSTSDGKAGAVDAINTGGDLDDKGWPKSYDDPSEYVSDELTAWTREYGGDYERAIADGYGR